MWWLRLSKTDCLYLCVYPIGKAVWGSSCQFDPPLHKMISISCLFRAYLLVSSHQWMQMVSISGSRVYLSGSWNTWQAWRRPWVISPATTKKGKHFLCSFGVYWENVHKLSSSLENLKCCILSVFSFLSTAVFSECISLCNLTPFYVLIFPSLLLKLYSATKQFST